MGLTWKKEEKIDQVNYVRIYIAGPINSATAHGHTKNISNFMSAETKLRHLENVAVFNPALDVLTGIYDGEMNYEDYFKNDPAWLRVSDCMVLIDGWRDSSGAAMEVGIAKAFNIKIFIMADLDDDMSALREFVEEKSQRRQRFATLPDPGMSKRHDMPDGICNCNWGECDCNKSNDEDVELLTELWSIVSSTIQAAAKFAPNEFNDNEYYRKLRKRLIERGVGGVKE